MNIITQEMKYRLSILRYADKHGVTQTAIKYHTNRQFIYRLHWRYDGTGESLLTHCRRPHSHPNQHTPEEIKLIKNMYRRKPSDGLVVLWVKLMLRGYKRTISGLYKCLKRMGIRRNTLPNPKYIPQVYQPATFPGEKVPVDVKVVPKCCIVGQAKELGQKMYQYTAIDEYSRFRYVEAFPEQRTYSSMIFLKHLIKRFRFSIHKIQTDNGFEFTNRFGNSKKAKLTLFEKALRNNGIIHKKIRPYTPRHNGKVERSHRKDNEHFYSCHKFYCFEDFSKQLAVRNREYNNFPMRPLNWKSPKEFLASFYI